MATRQVKAFIVAACIALVGVMVKADINTTLPFFSYNVDSVTVANTSIGFTSSVITPTSTTYKAEKMTCKVKCAVASPCRINIRADGSAATTSTGDELDEGDRFDIYWQKNIKNFRAIRNATNSATLICTVWRLAAPIN